MSAPLALTVELTDAQLEVLAERVAEVLRAAPAPAGGLVDAATVAGELGVSRDTVYAHAEELGGVQIGDGERPRWRFDLERARAAWQPAATPTLALRRRGSANGRVLLPVHGEQVAADSDPHDRLRIERL
jgi:hypothetical protein